MKKFVVAYLCVIVLAAGLFMGDMQVQAQVESSDITENERAGVVAGMVMGLDMALALEGKDSMGMEKWAKLTMIFEEATRGCKKVRCITDHIVTLRESVKKQVQEKPGVSKPWDQRLY